MTPHQQEAERRYPDPGFNTLDRYNENEKREFERAAFIAGAEWAKENKNQWPAGATGCRWDEKKPCLRFVTGSCKETCEGDGTAR